MDDLSSLYQMNSGDPMRTAMRTDEPLRINPDDLQCGELVVRDPILVGGWAGAPNVVRYYPQNETTPTRFVIVRDGEEREAVLVERAVHERLISLATAAEAFRGYRSSRELGIAINGILDALDALDALQPGDRNPLP